MRRLVAAFAVLVSFSAFGATLNWTHPTSYSDGSALEWSNGTTFGTVAGSQVVTGTANTATAPDPAAGSSRCYRVKTTVVAAKGGQTSDPSNVACVNRPFPKPNPPTLLEVLIAWIRSLFGRFA